MSQINLHLIEPTLFDQTGHSYTFVQCVLQANAVAQNKYALHVWLDHRGSNLFVNSSCTVHAYFYRRWRQVQKIFLYYRLLQQEGTIFVGTCELWDLRILAFFARLLTAKVKAKVLVHFHQFKQSSKKLACLERIAAQQPQFIFATPTDKLTRIFSTRGFAKCITIPCPTYPRNAEPMVANTEFKKVLYAGAARSDKGFAQVVELLDYNRKLGKDILFELQISAPNSQRYDSETQIALQKLHSIATHNVVLHANTLDQTQYLNLFKHAICLLIYKPLDYANKFSAVALDAFYAGCPIITAKDTWMGDMAEKYGAGIALATHEYHPAAMQAALERIIQDYAVFHVQAKAAAQELSVMHDPSRVLEVVGGFG